MMVGGKVGTTLRPWPNPRREAYITIEVVYVIDARFSLFNKSNDNKLIS